MKLDASLLSDLWFFKAAAEEENIRRAAESLSVSQSAVTQRIKKLEARMDIPLFQKSGRSVELTGNGRKLLLAMQAGIKEIAPVVSELTNKGPKRTIRVSCVPSFSLEWLMPKLGAFYERHSDLSVEVFGEVRELSLAQMELENIDVSIRFRESPASNAPVAFQVTEPSFPVVSPEYLDQHPPGEDNEITLLHDSSPWDSFDVDNIEWQNWLDSYQLPWPGPYRHLHFNLAQLAYQSAEEGRGVAIGRNRVVQRYILDGRLVKVPETSVYEGHKIVVHKVNDANSGAVELFLDWLNATLKEGDR
jgi:DNA-binding transcriptional LysR family regulator